MKLAVRISVSIVILAVLAWLVPLEQVKQGISRLPSVVWVQTIIVFLVLHIASAFKWSFILGRLGLKASSVAAVQAHFYGLFSNMFLPTVVGGDVVRATIIARESDALTPVISSGIIDRLIDTAALLTFIAIAAFFVDVIPIEIPLELIGVILLVVVALVVVALLLIRKLWGSGNGLVGKLTEFLSFVLSNPSVICIAFAGALCIQGGFILLNLQLAHYIGISDSYSIWFFCWPLAKLVAMLPVSFGGIGVRDAALVGLLASYQIDAGAAFSQSLTWQATLIVSGLFAGLVAWLIGLRRR